MPKIIIEVEFDGPEEHAMSAIEAACDSGELQDIFNDYPEDSLEVTSVTHHLEERRPGLELHRFNLEGDSVGILVVERLNQLLSRHRLMPSTLACLIEQRVPINQELELELWMSDLPMAGDKTGPFSVGLLGVLNAICRATVTGKYIMARYDDDTGALLGFAYGEPKWKEDPK